MQDLSQCLWGVEPNRGKKPQQIEARYTFKETRKLWLPQTRLDGSVSPLSGAATGGLCATA
jgi:hypothetical protein